MGGNNLDFWGRVLLTVLAWLAVLAAATAIGLASGYFMAEMLR